VGAAADSPLPATGPVVNFGKIPVGKKATACVRTSHTGNTASTVKGNLAGAHTVRRTSPAPARPRVTKGERGRAV